ncbi:MAG: OmpH family outer membrane protein [Candidatus Omnitrophica bacterium]|nr:OmpH family outer membrane protein [Candidatus Omnitrophota bacterium]
MTRKNKNVVIGVIVVFMVLVMAAASGYAEVGKIGYVDLKRAFYEYEKTKNMEEDLGVLTEKSEKERTLMVEDITTLRDEFELLAGDAKIKKQEIIRGKLEGLQTFDKNTRQELLSKKNDMFKEVIEDIQQIVEAIGKKENYDYIIDSRNIMYAKEMYDITDAVLKRLK